MPNINGKAQQERTYDAIVVGSGISGGWAAKELTEKGLKVLMLERGKNMEHVTGYKGALNNPWDVKNRGMIPKEILDEHPVQSQCYAFQADNQYFWVNDKENPYQQDKTFNWLRGDHLGGRSLTWGKQSYRWSPMDFESNARDGHGVDWPIRYKDLEKWYDYVEGFAGISGNRDGLAQLPDGNFLPAMEMNCLETHTAEAIKKNWNDRRMIIGRVAHLTKPKEHHLKLGRGQCQLRNRCHWGCPYGAYFSSLSATIPAAKATGNLTIRSDANVSEVIYDEKTQRATGVRFIDRKTKQTEEYFAKIIFLNASTIGTTFVLLNSKSNRFPNGFGNDSGVIGHYLMDHHFMAGAAGDHDDFSDQYWSGRRPNGIYVPRFRNLPSKEQQKDYVRGFGFQGGADRGGWSRVNNKPGFGEALKKEMHDPGQWGFWLGGWAECLPYFENKVVLDDTKTDPHGLPLIRIDCEFKENEKAMRKDMQVCAAEMLEAAGHKNIRTFDDLDSTPPGHCIHEMGTCRMGKDPKTSALNGNNQMWNVPNVFVTDGACMASTACQNPSLTYMALTARAADFAVEKLKRGEL
ncbi:MAG: GMC family oxidoreductase [Saprospiraceae bacterium]|nr:GMC family oxidoreductase [Saprospiraceae bacterium]